MAARCCGVVAAAGAAMVAAAAGGGGGKEGTAGLAERQPAFQKKHLEKN